VRTGTLFVTAQANDSTGDLDWDDNYVENTPIGISISVVQSGTNMNIRYTSTSASSIGTMNYSITYLA
jgi:hypothetical protein